MLKITRCLFLAAIVVFPSTLCAALRWDTLTYKVKASMTDRSTVAVFPFANGGADEVVIDEIKPSCGCTTAELDKREYKGGESGEIRVTFTFGDRVGEQHKTVTVRYSEGKESTTVVLELFVDIPETIVINPRVQYWHLKDKPDARPIVISVAAGYEGKPVKASLYTDPGHSNFVLSDIEKTPDGKYIFSLAPKSTDITLTEAGEIVFEIPGAEPRKEYFYAGVRE